jgi:predicted nucleic acid-binding protein
MKYLLDTCVISELVTKKPNQAVVAWIDSIEQDNVFLSVITIGEISKGINKLPDSKKKITLENWLHDDLLIRFEGRIVSINSEVMLTWGKMVGTAESKGRKISAIYSLIAAIVLHGNFNLVARNDNDFHDLGITVINPWNYK